MNLGRWMILAFVASLLARPALADDLGSAKSLIQTNIDKAIVALQDKKLNKEDRNGRIIGIVDPIFDFELMAKLSLGKTHWTPLTPAKQKEFIAVFVHRLRESYLEKLDLYTDERVEYGAPEQVTTKIHVPTQLVSKENRISILYKLYKADAGLKIYDLEIQGVSVIQTYRTQFDDVLKKGTIEDLLGKLRAPDQITIPSVEP